MSSGAAAKIYPSWGDYGSAKAAVNSISAHLAAEETDITNIAIAPGRVNTDMQATLRSSGQNHMDKSQYAGFVEAFEQGQLLEPEQPGHVMARLMVNPPRELSGKFLR